MTQITKSSPRISEASHQMLTESIHRMMIFHGIFTETPPEVYQIIREYLERYWPAVRISEFEDAFMANSSGKFEKQVKTPIAFSPDFIGRVMNEYQSWRRTLPMPSPTDAPKYTPEELAEMDRAGVVELANSILKIKGQYAKGFKVIPPAVLISAVERSGRQDLSKEEIEFLNEIQQP